MNTIFNRNLSSSQNNSRKYLDSNYFRYIFWLFTSLFCILLSFHVMISEEQSFLSQLIIIGVIIIILFYYSSYIYNLII